MKLSREIRARLFDGELPPITGSGPCPAEAGKTYVLSSRVSLTVLKVRHRKGGGWSLLYELHDQRDQPRILRRTPGIQNFDAIRGGFDEYGYPAEPTPDVIKDAARESAYTSQPTSLSDAGEAIDERTQDAFSKEAQQADGLREQRRREKWDLMEEYRRAKEDAYRAGVDTSRHDRVIKDRIERIRRATRDRAA